MKLPSGECHKTSLLMSQHWFGWWLGAVRHQAITRANVNSNICHHMASIRHDELTLKVSGIFKSSHLALWVMSCDPHMWYRISDNFRNLGGNIYTWIFGHYCAYWCHSTSLDISRCSDVWGRVLYVLITYISYIRSLIEGISKYIHYNVWDEISYPFPYGSDVEVGNK